MSPGDRMSKKLFFAWQAYHRALRDAQVARARYLRNMLLVALKSLRDRICHRAAKWNIRWLPLCS